MEQAHVYESCTKFIRRDPVLKQANNERKAANVENHSLPIRRLKELLTEKVDWSSALCMESPVNCSGLNSSKVSHHAKVDLAFFHEHWDYYCCAWRAQRCQGSTQPDKKSAAVVILKQIGVHVLLPKRM